MENVEKKGSNFEQKTARAIIMLPVPEVRPYEKNPRKNAEAVKYVKASIEKFGFKQPIIVDSNRVIIAGHTRLEAAKSLGMAEVPCIVADDLTDAQVKALRLADNKVAEFSEWEMNLLGEELGELSEISDIDMGDFGFDLSEFDNIGLDNEETEVVEDEVPEEVEPVCKKGEIWLLGEHRLMCGDSTDAEDVAKLMNGERAVMTFSDAPYNVDFKGSMSNTTVNGVMVKHKGANTRHEAIHNDKMDKDDFFAFMMKILENIKANVTGAWYLSFSSVNLEELLNPLRASGMDWKSIIIWMKNQATLSMKDYKSRYEPIVYGRFNDAWYGNRGFEEDIWEYQRTLKNDLHPTMKPVPLIGKMVTDGSKEGEIVLDLFGGSGSTMIACEQLNRKARMMELDPHYCDVIIARWEKFTGQKAVKLEG